MIAPTVVILVELGANPKFRVVANTEAQEKALAAWIRARPDLRRAIADLLGTMENEEAE
jgi:hypothetical protein